MLKSKSIIASFLSVGVLTIPLLTHAQVPSLEESNQAEQIQETDEQNQDERVAFQPSACIYVDVVLPGDGHDDYIKVRLNTGDVIKLYWSDRHGRKNPKDGSIIEVMMGPNGIHQIYGWKVQ